MKTAIEWFVEQMSTDLKMQLGYELIEQAKEMEKQQIINGRITAPITTGDIELDRQEAEHYYTQEYGNETTEKLE